MKDMPSSTIKVSIIIPVYNVEKYLDKCVQSVLSQTLKKIEIFLIDDGSSDNSWNIVQKYAEQDKRIIAIQQENAGAAIARNRGLELARGEYIGFVDSDDYVDADYFEKLYKTAIEKDADIARAYVQSEIETSDEYQLVHSAEGYDNYYNVESKLMVEKNKLNLTSSNWLAIYRRLLLEKNNIHFIPEIRTGQDNVFNLHVSYFANKVVFLEDPSYYHMNRRDGSLMTGFNFTTDGLISRALVIEETVRFLNTTKNYDREVYAYRVKDVLSFFHSRLIKTNIDKTSRQKLIDILVPVWRDVKYQEDVRGMLPKDAWFINALNNKEALNKYIAYVVPTRQALSKAEKRRRAAADKIRSNKAVYRVLRPPIHILRKFNKFVDKILS